MNKKVTLKKSLFAFTLLAATSLSNLAFSQAPDAELTINYGQYTIVPQTQITPITIDAKVKNNGTAAITGTPIFSRVYLNPNLTTPVATFTSTAASTAPGATSTVTMGVFTPTVIGDYVFYNYITSGDVVTSNDTILKVVSVDQHEYARDSGTPISGIGVGAGGLCIIGSTFNVVNPARMDSVLVFFNPPTTAVGNVVQVKISAVVGGLPSATYIGESAPFTLTAAQCTGTGAIITLAVKTMTNTPLELAAGNYFVGFSKNTAAGPNYGLQCSAEIFSPGTVFGSINGSPYAELNSILAGFNNTPIIRPYVYPICNITTAAVAVDANCGNADGNATVTPANGTAPYTYLWSNAQTTATASNLAQGTYSVVVTDAYGCTSTVSNIIVNNISTLAMTVASQTNTTCFGSTNGIATVNVTGGTAPFTYTWTNNPSTTNAATNLGAGVYSVTVLDGTNCSSTINVTITSPTAITAVSTPVAPLCFGGTDGSATVTASGGASNYTYVWTGNASTTNAITNVGAGTYSVLITDGNGCQVTQQVVVTAPTALTASSTSTPETNGTDGTANAVATGGTSPYTYLWNNGATTQNITGLAAGTYSVITTDANGCVFTSTVTVTSVVGVTEIENGTIAIFPNPTQGIVTVSMDGIATGDITMEIIDITGKSVFTQKVLFDGNKTNYSLDLSSLTNGTYLIKLNMQDGTATRRIVLAD